MYIQLANLPQTILRCLGANPTAQGITTIGGIDEKTISACLLHGSTDQSNLRIQRMQIQNQGQRVLVHKEKTAA